MSAWDDYKEIRDYLDANDVDSALSLIERSRPSLKEIWGFAACLEASCYERKNDLQTAKTILEHAEKTESENFWIYYQLGALYRSLGLREQGVDAFRKGHSTLGWKESSDNRYVFTHDFFSPNIPDWIRWFRDHITPAPIRCLEIGSWQGGSATWLLDKIVAVRGGLLTCIDTFEGSSEHLPWIGQLDRSIEAIFDYNLVATGNSNKARKFKGKSQEILKQLYDEKFDFIYIDGAHEAKYVIQDAILSFSILEIGGYLLFDDVDYRFQGAPEQNTATAIDAFEIWFGSEIRLVERGRQALFRKIAECPHS